MSTSASLHSLYQLDPTNTPLRLWMIYRKLYDISIKTRLLNGNDNISKEMNWYKRRLLMNSVLEQRKFIESKEPFKVNQRFLESLIVFLMDMIEDVNPPQNLNHIPPEPVSLKDTTIIPPSNPTGTSCFCDSVIVAMFISTNKYDIILSKKNLFQPLWADEQLSKLKLAWMNPLLNKIEDSLCYTFQLKLAEEKKEEAEKKTKKVAEDILVKRMFSIVQQMRTSRSGEASEHYDETSRNIATEISELRQKLDTECGRGGGMVGEEFVQEDASAFFLAILSIGGWSGVFLSSMMELKISSFNISQEVIEKHGISLEIPGLLINDIEVGTHLQLVINSNWDKRKFFIEKDDEGMTAWNTSVGFVRISDPFVFLIQRDKPSGQEKKISTRITMPEKEIIEIPIMYYQNNETRLDYLPKTTVSPIFNLFKIIWKYQIFAILCHISPGAESGHYVLYFKYPQSNDNWYYYNDLGPIMQPVDIRNDKEHKQSIETDGYLFWADRII